MNLISFLKEKQASFQETSEVRPNIHRLWISQSCICMVNDLIISGNFVTLCNLEFTLMKLFTFFIVGYKRRGPLYHMLCQLSLGRV